MDESRRPLITRREARMIAEELHKLQLKDKAKHPEPPKEYLTMREAAEYTRRSYNFFQRNEGKIPRTKVGGRYFYTKEQLAQYMCRA